MSLQTKLKALTDRQWLFVLVVASLFWTIAMLAVTWALSSLVLSYALLGWFDVLDLALGRAFIAASAIYHFCRCWAWTVKARTGS